MNALPPLPRLPARAASASHVVTTGSGHFPSVLYRADQPPLALLPAQPMADPYSVEAVYQPADSVQARTAQQNHNGTPHNPLIPKKRRRTTPEELAVLEAAFVKNPLPSQTERAQLASRVGMTGRALQVWFQNRRQKEKKDAGAYHVGSSGASSTGSAPDADHDAADLEGLQFAFSSSPAPAALRRKQSSSTLNVQSTAGRPCYTGLPVNKENLDRLGPTASTSSFSAPTPPTHSTRSTSRPQLYTSASAPAGPTTGLPYTYSYSYPSNTSVTSQIPLYETDPLSATSTHRTAATSVIAAKKHVRKRPLGSHAPVARKPSLRNEFNFPPSPPKKSRVVDDRPPLRRSLSAASVTSAGSGLFGAAAAAGAGDGRARVWVDALHSGGAEAGSPPSQPAALGGEGPSSDVDAPGSPDLGSNLAPPAPSSAPAAVAATPAPAATTSRFRTRDEVWQHMASDAPSSPSASPAPLTRKMMLALAAEEGASASNHFPTHGLSSTYEPPITRRPLLRALSLGRISSSSTATSTALTARPSLSTQLEGSRAGGEEACAIEAFERKRARALGEPVFTGTSAAEERPAKSARRCSSGGVSGGKMSRTRETSTASQDRSRSRARSSGSPTSSVASSHSGGHATTSEMGDLSFSSTSTASTASSHILSTPVDAAGSFFALANAAKVTAGREEKEERGQRDEEQECAELLLGLGGFF